MRSGKSSLLSYGSMLRFGFAVAAGSVALLCGSGCSSTSDAATKPIGQTFPVSGSVVLKNGSPLKEGRVVLVGEDPTTPPSSGEIQADGKFTLTTKSPGDGAVAGKYKVRVESASASGKKGKVVKPPFPAKYLDEDSSNVVVTVQAAPTTLDPIELK